MRSNALVAEPRPFGLLGSLRRDKLAELAEPKQIRPKDRPFFVTRPMSLAHGGCGLRHESHPEAHRHRGDFRQSPPTKEIDRDGTHATLFGTPR